MTEKKSFIRRKAPYHAFLVVVLGILVYSNTFHAPFVFDDIHFLVENPLIRDSHYLLDPARTQDFSMYNVSRNRLVGFLSFALNYKLDGLNVTGYHIFNLAVHIVNALLIYWLVILTFRTPLFMSSGADQSEHHSIRESDHPDPGYSYPSHLIALFSALLFVCHPIQTQAVTYIYQRFASLATMFFLFSLVCYVKSRIPNLSYAPYTQKAAPYTLYAARYTLYALSLLFALVAMKTKEIAFTLPFIISLYELFFFRGGIIRRVAFLVPFFLAMLTIPSAIIGAPQSAGQAMSSAVSATKVQTALSRPDYLLTQFRVIVTYIRLLFFPVNQNLDYDYPVYHSFSDPEVFLSFLFILSILCLGIYLLFKSRIKPATGALHPVPHAPSASRLIAFGIFWFFITLTVESSVIPIADVINEHRVYLPSVGIFIAAATLVFTLAGRRDIYPAPGKTVFVFSLLIAVFSVAAFGRNAVWGSEVSLWRDVTDKSPQKARGYNNLGVAYEKEGDSAWAFRYFDKALSVDPYYYEAYFNRGLYYEKKGEADMALADFNKALSIDSSSYRLYNARGLIYDDKGEFEKAVEDFTLSLSINPDFEEAYNNRGTTYEKMGQFGRAIKDYNTAISIRPDYAEAHYNLGNSYLKTGSLDGAMAEYTVAIGLKPSFADAYNNRGFVYFKKGNYDMAIADCDRAIVLKPGFAEALDTRGAVYAGIGEYDKAIEDFSRAIALNPDLSEPYVNRGDSYLKTGDRKKAVHDLKKACDMGNGDGCRRLRALRGSR